MGSSMLGVELNLDVRRDSEMVGGYMKFLSSSIKNGILLIYRGMEFKTIAIGVADILGVEIIHSKRRWEGICFGFF